MTYTYDCVWLPANHFLFQLANVCLVFSYFCFPSLNGLIALRFFLGLAGLFFALWGWLLLCALDTFLWNLVFFVGNFTHLGYILFSRRPIKFSEEMEGVYEKIFKPHGVPRHQFKILAEAAELETEFMYPGKIYMIEGVTLTDSLSIIAKGRMEVKKKGKLLHVIKDHQFINSPEWVVSQDLPHTSEVTIICQKECRVTSWNRKTLLDILQRNPYLKTVINSVVSIDVAQKVFAMNKIMLEGFGEMRHSIYTSNELGHDIRNIPGTCESSRNDENWLTHNNDATSLLINHVDHSEMETNL